MRPRFVVASVTAGLVLGGVVGWFVADRVGGDDEVTTAEVALSHFDDRHVHGREVVWWNDSRNTLRFSPTESGFTVEDRIAAVRWDGGPITKVDIDAGSDQLPRAVAALPGSTGGTWVAVAMPRRTARSDDPSMRAVSWSGDTDTATASSEIPIDVSTERKANAGIDVDVALAQSGDTVSAIVSIDEYQPSLGHLESKNAALALCADVTACRWEPLDLPEGAHRSEVDIASTGSGYVLVTGREAGERQVWFADAGDLDWTEVDGAMTDAEPRLVQDGEGSVLVVWDGRPESRERKVAIQSIDASGTVTTEVPAVRIGRIMSTYNTVITDRGDWFLGGSLKAYVPEVQLGYRLESAVLLQLRDDEWRSVGGDYLSGQIGQRTVAIVPAGRGDHRFEMATTALSPAIDMFWRVGHLADD